MKIKHRNDFDPRFSIPPGTEMLFLQSCPPKGWTKKPTQPKPEKRMAEQVKMWKSLDGDVYHTEEEADAKNAIIKDADEIEQYLSVLELKRGTATRMRQYISEFLSWRRENA